MKYIWQFNEIEEILWVWSLIIIGAYDKFTRDFPLRSAKDKNIKHIIIKS